MTRRIRTIADLDQLRNQECAVVFIWVEWAIHARQSAITAERMMADWKSARPSANVNLSQIDLSQQTGEMWDAVDEWLESQSIPDSGSLMYGGAGSILWVHSGTIVKYVLNAHSEMVDGLVAMTNQCFSWSEINNAK